MGTARLLLLRFKNAASNSARLYSSSAALIPRRLWNRYAESDDSDGESAVYKRALKLQRPTTIRYQESLHNSVSLIGQLKLPLKACKCVKFGVHTLLKVKESTGACRDLSRVLLKFWNEMAEMSIQHLKQYDLVYVSGRLGSYEKLDENGSSMRYYEVDVTEINFVAQQGLGPACQNLVKLEPKVSAEEIMQKRRTRLHLWHIFFANPSEWWDNRKRKSHPKAPDFKHKDTGEVLWIKDNDPPWINQQLRLHDSGLSKQGPGEHRNAWSYLSPLVL